MTADVFLTGDEGFWEHWRTALTERPDSPGGPLRMDVVVEPLVALFELHWAAAIAWQEYLKGAAGVLHLLALGWSDARIAAALGISGRTVSRRVAEAMTSAGVHSRFQLGMRYTRTAGENTTTLVPGRPGL